MGLLASCRTRTASASLRCCQGVEQGRAELSEAHPLAGAMERPWAGAETGAGRVVLWAQEVELEAEAEAVVVLGPRSVLLPSVDRGRGDDDQLHRVS